MTLKKRAATREFSDASYTIEEFCQAEKISAPTYYELRKKGLAPREMRMGGQLIRISHRARLDWHKKLESPTKATRAQAATLRERALHAVKRSVASERHVSRKHARDH
jgi:hypothetical protein